VFQAITTPAAGQSGVARQVSAARDAPVPARDQVVAGPVPLQPPGFLPRPALIAELDKARRHGQVVHVVMGMPGVGKTQLAAAYARAKVAADWRVVAWVSAGSAGSLLAGLAAVADAAGLSGGDSARDAAEAGQAVRQRLEADGERCLLVFDDVDDPDLVRPFVPAGGSAQVLITSARQPPADLGISITVDVFSEEEALAFLDGRTGLGEAGGAPVAGQLGYLPLALAQAAAAIAGERQGYRRYLKRLHALPPYPSPEQEQPDSHRVAGPVLLALQAANASDQTGVSSRVLAIMAVLSAGGARRELLYAAGQKGALDPGGRPVGGAAMDQALEALAERSLLSVSLDGQTVVMHHLVARVIREALAGQGQLALMCRVASSVLETHAHALAGSGDRRAVMEIPEQVAALVENTARLAGAAGQDLADAALRLRFLALSALVELGDGTQAVALGRQLTADLDRLLGRNHPDTLKAREGLAAAYQLAGLPEVAIAMFQLVLADRERTLGPDHPDTMRSRNNLASAYRKTGEVARAIPLVERILATRERLLGADHPTTLRARNNLAAAYREAGRAAEAIPLFEQNLAACERLLGPDDRRTQAARHNLALARREAARAKQP
jgi:tetratricopeptide (TPR) repeat protein